MKQTSRIISTYSADVMGVCSALFELGGMTIMHDASGCNSTYTTHDEPRWYDMDSMVYISAVTEMEAIMGDDEKLLGDIEDAVRELHPKFVAIAGTPIPTMTGFDFESVAKVAEQRTGVPCFGFPTTGMNTYVHGASMAFEGLAKRIVKDPKPATKAASESSDGRLSDESAAGTGNSAKVNIIGLTPLDFSVNGTEASICEWLESEGFEIVSRWAMGSALDEIAMAGEADVNLIVSASGLAAAKVLYERFGTPYVIGLPIGEDLKEMISEAIKDLAEERRLIHEKKEAIWHNKRKPAEDQMPACADSTELWPGESIYPKQDLRFDLPDHGADDNSLKDIVIIGEGVTSLALASAIELETGRDAVVLCATECPEHILRPKDRMTPDEDDIIPELEGAKCIIADPLYRPICPPEAEFIRFPSEAFSGRLYRDEIPNIIDEPDTILKRL